MAGEITRFKPGASGNPAGSSKKARRRRLLREALDTILSDHIPPDMLERLPESLSERLPEDLTFADLAALRLTMLATAGDPQQILAACSQILAAQARPETTGPPANPEPPRLPSTLERRQAIARQLGVDLEEDLERTVH